MCAQKSGRCGVLPPIQAVMRGEMVVHSRCDQARATADGPGRLRSRTISSCGKR
ncbi:MAG: hypothetical protein IPL78_28345 [Chloroflexi bacterium]|nr:hypothetical protein [Chloroflexota bacterium]